MNLKKPEGIDKDSFLKKTKEVKQKVLENEKVRVVSGKIFATKKSKRIFFSVVAVVLIGTISFSIFGGSSETIIKEPSVTTLQHGDLSERITASGTARPAETNSVFIEVSQKVKDVLVEVGDDVKEGDELISYDIEDTKKELENKVRSAEIALEDAQKSLNSLIEPASGTEKLDLEMAVLNAEKTLSTAKTELENADIKISEAEKKVSDTKTEMEVNQKLLDMGAISQVDYDTSVQNYNNALADLETQKTDKTAKESAVKTAELSLEKSKLDLENGNNRLNDDTTALNYEKQKNAVETAEMNLETARRNLEKLTEMTYSPINGTVIESSAVEGEMVTDSKSIMTIADLSKIEIDAYVSEYDISSVQVGQKVEITSDGIEGKVYTGTVIKIEPQASVQQTISGSETVVPVVISMDNPDENVKPGFSFDLEIVVKDMSDVDYIPISSLKKNDDGSFYVFTLDEDDKLVKTPVEIGGYSDINAEVISGLTAEQRIVEAPTDEMEEGKSISEYKEEITINISEEESSLMQGAMPGMSSGNMGNMGGGQPSMRMMPGM